MQLSIPGAATVRIAIPTNMQSNLIFHYNLKFYESEGDTYDGVSLKRFVMQVKTYLISYYTLCHFSKTYLCTKGTLDTYIPTLRNFIDILFKHI